MADDGGVYQDLAHGLVCRLRMRCQVLSHQPGISPLLSSCLLCPPYVLLCAACTQLALECRACCSALLLLQTAPLLHFSCL